MKKLLVIGIIVLFIGMSIPSTGREIEQSSISPLYDGKTLYVGGSGPNNYTSIQDAIDNASDGDTVFVFNGSYSGNLIIDKSIKLIGEDRNITIIRVWFNGDAIYITADDVEICGFKIRNGDNGIHLLDSNNNNIHSNIVYGNGYGIVLYNSEGNKICSNLITLHWQGIILEQSHNNIILDNNISENEWLGIHLEKSNNNTISYNKISEHYWPHSLDDFGCGIYVEESNFINISYNNLSNNEVGIYCKSSNENKIIYNILENDSSFLFYKSDKNNITHNIFSESGIFFDVSDENNIVENNFKNNSGISLWASYFNTINYNNFFDGGAFFNYCIYIGGLWYGDHFGPIPKIIKPNNWNYNYWGKPRFLPKPIFGTIGIFEMSLIHWLIWWLYWLPPWINFDWHPAKEPYDIEV